VKRTAEQWAKLLEAGGGPFDDDNDADLALLLRAMVAEREAREQTDYSAWREAIAARRRAEGVET
jgi:hypothetical protein